MFGLKSKCKLHKTEFEKKSVKITYGLIRLTKEYLEAKKTLFPNAGSYVLGGCRVGDEKVIEMKFCQMCFDAEINWSSENQTHKI